MDADEAIRLRRSVRSYTDQPVPDADIDAILRLALLAESSEDWSIFSSQQSVRCVRSDKQPRRCSFRSLLSFCWFYQLW